MRLSPALAIVVSLIMGATSLAHETLRPTQVEHYNKHTREEFVFVPGSEVAWADFAAIRRDFPHLRSHSNDEIKKWIISNYAFMSRGQIELRQLRNSSIPADMNQVQNGIRPHKYNRASVLGENDLIDLKGTGLSPEQAYKHRTTGYLEMLTSSKDLQSFLNDIRTKGHSDGLMGLGEAIAEMTRQQAAQKLFDLQNANQKPRGNLQTVESYFIIALPVDIYKKNGERIPAAIYGRQTHFGRGKIEVPDGLYSDDQGKFQASRRGTAVDFGGVVIEHPKLSQNFGVPSRLETKDAQASNAWKWGHETANAYRRGDRVAVYRHLQEMIGPVLGDWKKLPVAQRMSALEKPQSIPRSNRRTLVQKKILDSDYARIKANLASSDIETRKEAINRLGEYYGQNRYELFSLALNDADQWNRYAAAIRLSNYSGDKAKDLFLMALKDKEPNVRSQAAASLAHYKGEDAFEVFSMALKSPHSQIEAAKSLRTYRGPDADKLVEFSLKDEMTFISSYAAEALRGYSGPNARALFEMALSHNDDETRRSAALSLGPDDMDMYFEILKNPRYASVRDIALARILMSGSETEIQKAAMILESDPERRGRFLQIHEIMNSCGMLYSRT